MELHLSVERLLSSKDFERVLACSSLVRKKHFALHFLADCPSALLKQRFKNSEPVHGLGASAMQPEVEIVNGLSAALASQEASTACKGPMRVYLGLVVPKRHARRSAMRSLIKRKIRTVFAQAADRLPRGMWVVRLARPLPAAEFTSAQSVRLRQCLQSELAAVMEHGLALIHKRATAGT